MHIKMIIYQLDFLKPGKKPLENIFLKRIRDMLNFVKIPLDRLVKIHLFLNLYDPALNLDKAILISNIFFFDKLFCLHLLLFLPDPSQEIKTNEKQKKRRRN